MNEESLHAITEAVNGPNTRTKHEVIGVLGTVAICEAYCQAPFEHAKFTGVILRDGVWKRTGHYSESADAAMLETLGHKYEGPNGRFGAYAARMLGLSDP